jgi:hypothetical protein
MSATERLVFGLFLVTVGLVWTLGNLGVLDALHLLRRTWPLFLVLWGTLEFVRGKRQEVSR